MALDPIIVEIIANRLSEIQRLMKDRLFRTGYSPILRESFDGSAGLTTKDGRLIGASGASFHTVPYARMAQWIVTHFGEGKIFPGDAFITNDPYKGGVAHTPDVGAAVPVFVDGHLVAFCTSMGHKPDIGGLAPSTASSAARSIFHEGLLVPPVKLYERGELNESVRSILANNTRTPRLLIGDIEGQVGCMRIGAELFQQLCKEYTTEVVEQVMDVLIDSSEARLRAGLRSIPDGVTETRNWLDEDGASTEPVLIHLKLTKKDDRLRIDFSGSDPQGAGPANTVEQSATAAAVAAVVSFVDHTIPLNEGVLRAIDVDMGKGRIVSPCWPAPVNSYTPGCQVVFNCITHALGDLAPERAFAENGLGLGGFGFGFKATERREDSVQYEVFGTALGGTSRRDGAPIVFTTMIYETVQPIEIIETEYPVIVRDFSMRQDSAGAGKHRGGMGYCKEWEVLTDCHLLSRMSGRKFTASGINGGKAPQRGRTILNPGTPQERELDSLAQEHLKAGDVVRIEQSGGGGWGNPLERSPAQVLADVMDGFVSIEAAARDYGTNIVHGDDGKFILAARKR